MQGRLSIQLPYLDALIPAIPSTWLIPEAIAPRINPVHHAQGAEGDEGDNEVGYDGGRPAGRGAEQGAGRGRDAGQSYTQAHPSCTSHDPFFSAGPSHTQAEPLSSMGPACPHTGPSYPQHNPFFRPGPSHPQQGRPLSHPMKDPYSAGPSHAGGPSSSSAYPQPEWYDNMSSIVTQLVNSMAEIKRWSDSTGSNIENIRRNNNRMTQRIDAFLAYHARKDPKFAALLRETDMQHFFDEHGPYPDEDPPPEQ